MKFYGFNIQSPKIHQRFNAKLSRALSFATNG
jgi:hypothetical protein